MNRPVRFLGAARAELRRAADHYDRKRPGLGDELLAEVERAVLQLCAFPESGAPHHAKTRRLPLRRFPFLVIYRLQGEELVVVAVAHQRRKPGYWGRR